MDRSARTSATKVIASEAQNDPSLRGRDVHGGFDGRASEHSDREQHGSNRDDCDADNAEELVDVWLANAGQIDTEAVGW